MWSIIGWLFAWLLLVAIINVPSMVFGAGVLY